jgi:hypothetical protein
MEILNFSKPLSRQLSGVFEWQKEEPIADSTTIDYGRYENINGNIAAVFTSDGKNFIYLDDRAIEITPDMAVDYFCAESTEEPSWLKLYKDSTVIASLQFINGSPAFINPFDGFEDWEAGNFAYYLARDIQDAIKHPDVPLYPRK